MKKSIHEHTWDNPYSSYMSMDLFKHIRFSAHPTIDDPVRDSVFHLTSNNFIPLVYDEVAAKIAEEVFKYER